MPGYILRCIAFLPDNAWPCSPDLSWMYKWSQTYVKSHSIQNTSFTMCHVDKDHPYPLILVMKYYTEEVLPSCPKKDGCTCDINHIQTKILNRKDRAYTVQVLCRNRGLTHFPKLPKNTISVDLSNNYVSTKDIPFGKKHITPVDVKLWKCITCTNIYHDSIAAQW